MGHGDNDEPPDEGSPGQGDSDRSIDGETDPELDRDEHADEHVTRGAPPDRGDRVWVHPTELVGVGASPPRGTAHPNPRRTRSWAIPVIAGAAGALAAVIALAVAGTLDSRSGHITASAARLGASADSSVQELASRAGLSIVAVAARDAAGTRRGSGVCIRHEGDVLTTADIVGRATTVEVRTNDGQKHTARVVGRDSTTDLVLLSMSGDADIPAAQLSDHEPDPGSPVMVVAATQGDKASTWASAGMLASNNAVALVAGNAMTGRLLATDAGTGAVASGGALLANNGQVVGIVVGGGKNRATTYAMPITGAVTVAEQLQSDGVAKHGSAGFEGRDAKTGPTVAKVAENGPAEQAGIEPGDVVTAVDGRTVTSINVVNALVRAQDPGSPVKFTIARGKHPMDISVVLTAST